MKTIRKFPGLSDMMQEVGSMAEMLGLSLAQFNSGSKHNPSNGFRIFSGPNADFFSGVPLIHLKTAREVIVWLDGYSKGQSGGKIV